MTNAEKFLKDGADIREFVNEYADYYVDETVKSPVVIRDNLRKFLEEQVKPKLTEDERAILRHLKGFYYIYRASTGELEATNEEHTWCGYELYLDDDVFQFIKERRRIQHKRIVGGEMKSEDENKRL